MTTFTVTAEITIEGNTNPERMREMIRDHVERKQWHMFGNTTGEVVSMTVAERQQVTTT